MKKEEYALIRNALFYVSELIKQVGCPDYSCNAWKDDDIRKMFYDINNMCVDVFHKMDADE